MPDRRSVCIALALAAGYAVVLAGPMFLLWNALRPEPWTQQSVRVRFEYLRYQAGGLVFTYTLENRTHTFARFLPESTTIRAIQPDDLPDVGYPSVSLPLDLEPGRSRRVDVRLEIPSLRAGPLLSPPGIAPEDLFGPSDPDRESPLSPLPRPKPLPGAAAPPAQPPANPLDDLNGFELVDRSTGRRIVFPRAW